MFSGSLSIGDDFKRMPPVKVIWLLNFRVFLELGDPMHVYGPSRRESPWEAFRKFQTYEVEMPKFRKLTEDLCLGGWDELDRWICLLTEGYDDIVASHALSEGNEAMEEHMRLCERAMADRKLRERCEMEVSASLEENTRLAEARLGGMESLSPLIQRLLSAGRADDISRVTSDVACLWKLLAEYGLA